mmetsp:Transcript_53157/g.99661  ORF Transcript_53157/g.99661 Transcript_53157/m.99661 type:complete len:244 (-) Transcript_53157:76-807(-)
MAVAACLPDWAKAGGSCPYGHSSGILLGTWTWPSEGVGAVHYVAAFYSFMPMLLLGGFVLLGFWTRGARELLAFLYQWICIWVMYALKLTFQQRRPEGSCSTSCGMPSGHTLESIGTLTWLLLEVFMAKSLEPKQKGSIAAIGGALLLPVGWSRVVFNDHSWPQVLAGAAFGVVVAVLWYGLLQQRIVLWLLKLIKSCLPFFQLNYPIDHLPEEAPWNPSTGKVGYGSTAEEGAGVQPAAPQN